jgi:hypothetical protein
MGARDLWAQVIGSDPVTKREGDAYSQSKSPTSWGPSPNVVTSTNLIDIPGLKTGLIPSERKVLCRALLWVA